MAHELNTALAACAAGQHGLLARDQILELGGTRHQIDGRIAGGLWIPVAPRVYAVAGTPDSWLRRVHAAALSIGDSVASRLTAAGLHPLSEHPPPMPHLTVAYGRSSRSSVAVVHRARLTPLDRTTVSGIPVTTIERTLVDLAAVLAPKRLQGIVDAALHTGRVTPKSIDAAWERSQRAPGRHGHANLLAALVDWREPILPGSVAEMRLLRQLRQWGYPTPERQVPILGPSGEVIARADLGWPGDRFGIEYDSERWHDPTRWSADEDRHVAIEALGWRLLRADKTDLRPGSRFRDDLARAWPRRPAA